MILNEKSVSKSHRSPHLDPIDLIIPFIWLAAVGSGLGGISGGLGLGRKAFGAGISHLDSDDIGVNSPGLNRYGPANFEIDSHDESDDLLDHDKHHHHHHHHEHEHHDVDHHHDHHDHHHPEHEEKHHEKGEKASEEHESSAEEESSKGYKVY